MSVQAEFLSFDPDKSRFILIGTSRCIADPDNLPELPAVRHNLDALERILLNPEIVGIRREGIIIIKDPRDKAELSSQLVNAARPAKDLLFIYYVGHGLLGQHNKKLYLATAQTTDANVDFDGFDFDEIRLLLDASQAKQRLLVLDCCFSGNVLEGALGSLDSVVDANIAIRSTYSIASAPPNRLSIADPDEKYTAFSGELIELLEHGTGGEEKFINADLLFDHLKRRIALKPKLPPPRKCDKYDGGKIVLARNRIGSIALEAQVTKLYQLVTPTIQSLNERIAGLEARLDKQLAKSENSASTADVSPPVESLSASHARKLARAGISTVIFQRFPPQIRGHIKQYLRVRWNSSVFAILAVVLLVTQAILFFDLFKPFLPSWVSSLLVPFDPDKCRVLGLALVLGSILLPATFVVVILLPYEWLPEWFISFVSSRDRDRLPTQ
jgi:hypothetical protein